MNKSEYLKTFISGMRYCIERGEWVYSCDHSQCNGG